VNTLPLAPIPGTSAILPATLEQPSSIHRKRLIFLGFQGVHLLALLSLGSTVRPVVLGLSGVLCVVAYGWLLKAEVLAAGREIVSPFVLYLCAAVLILGLSPTWAAFAYAGGFYETFAYGRFDVSGNLMDGHRLLLFGDWLLIAGYAATAKWQREDRPCIMPAATVRVAQSAIVLILVGWALEIAALLGVGLGGLGNFYKAFAYYSGPAGLLMLLYARFHAAGSLRPILLAVILGCFAIELALAFRSNMKQAAMQVVLPFVIVLVGQVIEKRNGRIRLNFPVLAMGAVICAFVTLILFPFNEMRRAHAWEGRTRIETPPALPFLIEALHAAVPGTPEFADLHQFPETGFWSFLSRHAYLIGSGWAYQHVDNSGHVEGEFLRDGLISLVPRLVWSDKPMISGGRKITVMLGQAQDVESAMTSTDAGSMAGALYLNWGFPSLVIGMFVNGVVLSLLWTRIRPDMLINPFAAVTAMLLYVAAGRFFANALDGNLAFFVTIAIFYLPLIMLTRAVFRGRAS
jgi:hypothetical protein